MAVLVGAASDPESQERAAEYLSRAAVSVQQ